MEMIRLLMPFPAATAKETLMKPYRFCVAINATADGLEI